MSESKHTPGPWEFSIYGQEPEMLEKMRAAGIEPVRILTNEGQAVVTANHGQVALVACQSEYKRGKGHLAECAERDANAHLIAAAPDLLGACEAFAAFERHTPDCANCNEWGAGNCEEAHKLYSVACDSINEAIAKARGE